MALSRVVHREMTTGLEGCQGGLSLVLWTALVKKDANAFPSRAHKGNVTSEQWGPSFLMKSLLLLTVFELAARYMSILYVLYKCALY